MLGHGWTDTYNTSRACACATESKTHVFNIWSLYLYLDENVTILKTLFWRKCLEQVCVGCVYLFLAVIILPTCSLKCRISHQLPVGLQDRGCHGWKLMQSSVVFLGKWVPHQMKNWTLLTWRQASRSETGAKPRIVSTAKGANKRLHGEASEKSDESDQLMFSPHGKCMVPISKFEDEVLTEREREFERERVWERERERERERES